MSLVPQKGLSQIRIATLVLTLAGVGVYALMAWQLKHYTQQLQTVREEAVAQAGSRERESYQALAQCRALNTNDKGAQTVGDDYCLAGLDPEQARQAQRLSQDIAQRMQAVPVPALVRLMGGGVK